mgnify:CR=1 FL=1
MGFVISRSELDRYYNLGVRQFDGAKMTGVMFATDLPADSNSELLAYDGKDGREHWVGFHNFFVITKYNRSVMYALAAHQLGQEIALGGAQVAHAVQAPPTFLEGFILRECRRRRSQHHR